jgi:hypothetical protein
MIRKFERGIRKRSKSNIEAALLYIDLIMCAQDL